jgi:hypothetical protein
MLIKQGAKFGKATADLNEAEGSAKFLHLQQKKFDANSHQHTKLRH